MSDVFKQTIDWNVVTKINAINLKLQLKVIYNLCTKYMTIINYKLVNGPFNLINGNIDLRKVKNSMWTGKWMKAWSNVFSLDSNSPNLQFLFIHSPLCCPRGGHSSMIWVGTCHWDLKSRPIFIPNFAEKWDPFLYQSHKF